ncbi:hypothetical protein, partial [Micromonospora sp. NPDC002575]|uniref:hypothetical protein n=1 Tax=Micromonospora sp. NPDC002575 TaxID=3364222 RepID=UPI0036BA6B74
HDARNLLKSRKRFASFAYIAEQYGYEYSGLSSLSPSGSPNPYFAFRRMPDAAERAMRTAEQHPDALNGGRLPGMHPGGDRLTPLPEAQHAVGLLHARIEVDYSGTQKKRGLIQLLIMPLALLIPLSQFGFTPTSVMVCAGAWLFAAGLWALGVTLARRRYARHSDMLEQAGIPWPPSR